MKCITLKSRLESALITVLKISVWIVNNYILEVHYKYFAAILYMYEVLSDQVLNSHFDVSEFQRICTNDLKENIHLKVQYIRKDQTAAFLKISV